MNKGQQVVYNGNRLVDYVGKKATILSVGNGLATIKFSDGKIYDCARVSHLSLVGTKKLSSMEQISSAIAWGLKNTKTGKFFKGAFTSRNEARENKEDGEVVVKVQLSEVK